MRWLYSTECALEFLVWWDAHSEILAGNAKRRTVEIWNKSYVHLFVGGRPTSRSASKWKMSQYSLGVAVEPSLVQKGIGSKICFTASLHITLKYEIPVTYHALVFQGDRILNYACLIFKFQSWCSNMCQLDIQLKHFRHKLVWKIRCVSCKEVSLTWPAAKWNKKSVGLVCQHGNHCFGVVHVNKWL